MFRFTIRDVLWLTVVVAMALGWGQEVTQRGPETVRLRTKIEALIEQSRLDEAAAKRKHSEVVKWAKSNEKLYHDSNQRLESMITSQELLIRMLRDEKP